MAVAIFRRRRSQPAEVMEPHQCSSIWTALLPATSHSLRTRQTSSSRSVRGIDYGALADLAVKREIRKRPERVLLWWGYFTHHWRTVYCGIVTLANSLGANTRFQSPEQGGNSLQYNWTHSLLFVHPFVSMQNVKYLYPVKPICSVGPIAFHTRSEPSSFTTNLSAVSIVDEGTVDIM